MIAGILHKGSGLGDQLHRYITVRCLAEKKHLRWGMIGAENFKGLFFKDLDLGFEVEGITKQWNEKDVRDANGVDIRSYDPEINFVEDGTVIDGSFEDEKYWGDRIDDIREWLEVEPLFMPENLCVVGFRGGEYVIQPDLFLTKDYYDEAVFRMRKINPDMQFQVHTDDPVLARQLFPDFEVVDNKQISHSQHENMGYNWRAARYAKYLIIPNSAFFILPALLGDAKQVIAPRYWARHNTGVWARPACYYKDSRFLYI